MKAISIITLSILANTALGAGGSSHGSVSDLMFPAINFIILFSFLIWKIKKPLRNMFKKNAEEVTNLYEYADKRDKEAKIKLEMFQKKMENLESEKNKIFSNTERETREFIEKTKKESDDFLNRLAKDAENKIEHEKKSMLNKLQEELVLEVISKTKSQISSDASLNKKATDKLISQIR